jgi:hypothetical protein
MGMADPETGHKGMPEKIVRARSGALLVLILRSHLWVQKPGFRAEEFDSSFVQIRAMAARARVSDKPRAPRAPKPPAFQARSAASAMAIH